MSSIQVSTSNLPPQSGSRKPNMRLKLPRPLNPFTSQSRSSSSVNTPFTQSDGLPTPAYPWSEEETQSSMSPPAYSDASPSSTASSTPASSKPPSLKSSRRSLTPTPSVLFRRSMASLSAFSSAITMAKQEVPEEDLLDEENRSWV